MSRSFTITTWKEGKYYVAQCLNIDVSSFGETYEQAIKNVTEAAELYLEDANQSDIQNIEVPSLTVTTVNSLK